MKLIPILNNDAPAIVDDEDEAACLQHKWHIASDGYASSYAVGFMHHFLIGKPPVGMVIDHIDTYKLNNCRYNLRFITVSQNAVNFVTKLGEDRNIYCFMQPGLPNPYYVQFQRKRKRIYLGPFTTKEQARAARDEWFKINEPETLRYT